MIVEFSLQTGREGFYNISSSVAKAAMDFYNIEKKNEAECLVFCPHTTAGITINENADSDVVHDMLLGLAAAFPVRNEFRHAEGNSHAHLKASCVGSSARVIVRNGGLLLGTWQGIFFCEFDGPRSRKYFVQIR
ncbi:MAG: secondary thiamine-phosphate synthase enzyme YjbQ [Spirochaetaceae bacterium]|jgi:secondary thiamine-phosphate synthase enzyme|nr:secondary thiamine-phosphate synthase enzyme YjbQ [Spirochaetaceae bacterium]